MEWTIGELAERASTALASTARLNGRVRDVPNERLIRWYSTIGLLDPPVGPPWPHRPVRQAPPAAAHRRQTPSGRRPDHRRDTGGAHRSRRPDPGVDRRHPGDPGRDLRDQGSPPPLLGRAALRRTHTAPPPDQHRPPTRPDRPLTWPRRSPPRPHLPPPRPDRPLSHQPPSKSTGRRHRPPRSSTAYGWRAGVTVLLDGGGRAPSPDDLAEITAASEALLSVLRERGLTSPEREQS